MNKKLLTSLVCALLFSLSAYAQVNVSGTVTDSETGELLPGVNVYIQALQRGDATNLQGRYSINNVPAGTYTLTATYVGYETFTTSLVVGSQNVVFNISMTAAAIGLSDVVVTAFGVERERRALGYGVSSVGAASIERSQDTDLSRALAGKLPGVVVGATGGTTGSGTNIVIRGYTTINGSNTPLFIVDGIRIDGSANTNSGFAVGGGTLTTPNRFQDIDPSNIASVTVLKGLSATAIYGEQGKNGVILITTKSGSFASGEARPGFDVTFDQSVYNVEIASRPSYQDSYGVGFDQAYGAFFSNWGPRFTDTRQSVYGTAWRGLADDGTVQVLHMSQNHAATAAAFPEFANVPYRYQAYQDPLDAFFRTGTGAQTSLGIAGGVNDVRVNVNFSRTNEEGFTPNNDLSRTAFGIGASYQVNPRFRAQTSFNLGLTEVNSPVQAAGGGSGPGAAGGTSGIFQDVFYTPRSVDLGGFFRENYQNPVTGGNVYYRGGNDIVNPWWSANNIATSNVTDRYYGKTEFDFKVFEGLNLNYRLGYDAYTEIQEYRQNKGGVNPAALINGFYQSINSRSTIWDHNVSAMYDFQLTSDISLDGLAGFQFTDERFERNGLDSREQIIFDFWEHSNFTTTSSSNFFTGGDYQFRSERRTAGVYADATLGFRDYIYLNVAGRNDWFSTLEKDNRSIFYPSVSLSFIASDALGITSDLLSYLKFFVGRGSSAGSPSPYSTRSSLAVNTRAFINTTGAVITTNAQSTFLGNPNLKPELISENEIGFEVRLLQNMIGLEATAYQRNTTDLITTAPIDPSTGFTSTLVNIGEIESKGLEVALNVSPLRGDLQWDINTTFFTDATEVISLGTDLDQIQVGGGFTTRGNFAIVGKPFLVMRGTKIERDADGTPLVNASGNYFTQAEIGDIGNPNPEYTLGFSNTFRYKGASLSFQFDYQKGGDIFSTWISTLMARGLTKDTDRVDRSNTFIMPGVRADGSQNNVQISVSGVFFDNLGFGADELRVYDATHIRLSEVVLSYDLPTAIVRATPFKGVTLSVTGNNLWMFAPNVPEFSGFDPNVNSLGVGNARGFEYLTGPSARRFGGKLRVRF